MDAQEVCRQLVLLWLCADPANGGDGTIDPAELRTLVARAGDLFHTDQLDEMRDDACEFNADGLHTSDQRALQAPFF